MRILLLLLTWCALALAPALPATAAPASETALRQALAAGAAPVAKASVSPGPQRTERIEAELVPMGAWAVPGSTAVVAIRQSIKPGWHTYWRNQGDSGGPTSLTWSLPAGVAAGDILWPLPERQRLQSLMNYGYSGVVFLPVPVEIPADAKTGQSLPLRVTAHFYVCSDEMCVPEDLDLALDLPVREGAAPLDARFGQAIQDVVASAPRPAGIEARAALSDGKLIVTARDGPLAGVSPKWAYFFPFEGGVIDHAAAQSGERGPQGLTLGVAAGRGLTSDLTSGDLIGPINGVLSTDLGAWEITAEPGAALTGVAGEGAIGDGEGLQVKVNAAGGSADFAKAALFALLGGLILNLMPCVFPILAMKAASLSRAAHDPAEARRDGLAFLAGVLATFVVLAGGLLALRAGGQALGWGFQLQSPAVVAALALLMLAVALNLSGVFHIGAGLQGAGQGPLSRLPGAAGAFFTGVLAVVVAAPCTAPFMAFALGAALVMPWPMALAVFLMLGLGLALPYVLISLNPRLLARLPKPGPWMETLRNLLAFPMYGAALWLAWVYGRQTADALALLFGSGLMLALALWLYGRAQAAAGKGRAAGISALLALIAALGLGALAAKAAPAAADGAGASTHLSSNPWSEQAVQAALAEGRPVLVNFTADWCVTCKVNESTALSSARTAQALKQANAVYLVGDWTRRDDAITAELQRHGRSGVPLYLVYAPGKAEPRILPQLLTEGVVIDALKDAAA